MNCRQPWLKGGGASADEKLGGSRKATAGGLKAGAFEGKGKGREPGSPNTGFYRENARSPPATEQMGEEETNRWPPH